MIRFFLFFKKTVFLSCFLTTAFAASSPPAGGEPSEAPVKELRRIFEDREETLPAAPSSPRRQPSLVSQCYLEIGAGKAQRLAEAKRDKRGTSPSITEEAHHDLLNRTVLSSDIAPNISKFLSEQDIIAMSGTCHAAHQHYLNRGTCTLSLAPRPYDSRDPQSLLSFLYHNHLARGLALGSPNLTRLQQRMTDANTSFHLLTTVSLPNTGFFGFSLRLLQQLFPQLKHINLQNASPEELGRNHPPRNKIGSTSTLAPFKDDLVSLNLRYADVTNLNGLNQMSHLTSLDITGNPIPPRQYASLAHVPTLKSLTAAWDYGRDPSLEYRLTGADVAFLRGLTSLEELNLNWHNFKDLDPSVLAGHTRLRHLDLGRTDLPTIVFSQNFRLTHADLSENELTTIEPLRASTGMVSLNLSHNDISDLAPLEEMSGLRVLNVAHNRITSINPLSGCTAMEELDLTSNPSIREINPLGSMIQMRDLNISTTGTSSLLPLVRMTKLTHLNLNDNNVTDASPLSRLKSLQTLYLGANPILTEDPIYALENLIVLHLTGISVRNPEKLAGLSYLVELDLGKTGMTRLDMFQGLTFLSRLFLEENNLTNAQLNPLFRLTDLSTLGLENNPQITERHLTSLKDTLPSTDVVT